MYKIGTIRLSTLSAASLFEHELVGQFSDGMWENSRPYDHWKFWHHLIVKFEPGVEPRIDSAYKHQCKKVNYNIAALFPIIGDRMEALGRMAKAAESLGMIELSYDQARAAWYMPDDFASYQRIRNGQEKSAYGEAQKYFESLSPELAAAFYSTTYTRKDLKSDVKLIKSAMKTVKN
jgi:hypothetical protein